MYKDLCVLCACLVGGCAMLASDSFSYRCQSTDNTHSYTHKHKQALVELIDILPQVIEQIKATCPDMSKTDAQTLGANIARGVCMS